jgi:HSP20 family protein
MMTDLMRWSPFEELRQLADEFERRLSSWSRPGSFDSRTPVETKADDEAWHVRIALPGIDPKNVEVNVSGRTLHVRAEQKDGDAVARYQDVVTLPGEVDVDKISARFRHGLLELTMPKSETVKPRRIEIESGEGDHKKLPSAA